MSGIKGKSGRKPGFKNPNAGRPEKYINTLLMNERNEK